MKINNVKIKTIPENEMQHIKPTLKIEIEVEYIRSQEMILEIKGNLIINNKLLSSIIVEEPPEAELKPTGYTAENTQIPPTVVPLKGYIELDKEIINYIEKSRSANTKKDVIFDISLTVSYLKNKAIISYVIEYPLNSTIFTQQQRESISKHLEGRYIYNQNDISFLLYAYPYNNMYMQARSNLNLISADGSTGYIVHNVITKKCQCEISSSDWIHDYAPKLGIGSFLVLEIPFDKKSEDYTIIKSALDFISQAENEYRAWNIEGVLVNCRKAVEKLKNAVVTKFPEGDEWDKFRRIVENGPNGLFGFLSFGIHESNDTGEDHKNRKLTQYDAETALYFTKILVEYAANILKE